MAPVTRRTPVRSARPAKEERRPGGYRGAEGRRMMEVEEERAKARKEAQAQNANMPFRFYCPVGDTRQFIIVDEDTDFFRHEHCMKDKRTGRWDIYCECINEHANCPVCKVAERPSYFAMYLTIIDLTPYENKDGITVEWSKKLLVVKSAQQKKFARIREKEGTLRGALIEVTRDGDKDASIGNDISFLELVSEDELLSYETEYEDAKGKLHQVIGHEPFDYDELFPAPTEQQLAAMVGGKAEAGSREENDRQLGRRGSSRTRDERDSWDDARPARGRGRTDEPEEEAAPEEEEPQRRPARGATSARPPARTATRTASRTAREEEPEEEAPAEEEERPARRTTRAARPDPEEAPQRSTSSLAERRRALRR